MKLLLLIATLLTTNMACIQRPGQQLSGDFNESPKPLIPKASLPFEINEDFLLKNFGDTLLRATENQYVALYFNELVSMTGIEPFKGLNPEYSKYVDIQQLHLFFRGIQKQRYNFSTNKLIDFIHQVIPDKITLKNNAQKPLPLQAILNWDFTTSDNQQVQLTVQFVKQQATWLLTMTNPEGLRSQTWGTYNFIDAIFYIEQFNYRSENAATYPHTKIYQRLVQTNDPTYKFVFMAEVKQAMSQVKSQGWCANTGEIKININHDPKEKLCDVSLAQAYYFQQSDLTEAEVLSLRANSHRMEWVRIKYKSKDKWLTKPSNIYIYLNMLSTAKHVLFQFEELKGLVAVLTKEHELPTLIKLPVFNL